MNIFKTLSLASAAIALLAIPTSAQAQAEKYIAEIFTVGTNFCPRGSADLNGQLLAINSNQALFSLLGTTYGGDGRTTFALPDMRSRSPVHAGNGPGLNDVKLGQRGGTEHVRPRTAVVAKKTTGDGETVANADELYIRPPFLAIKYCIVTQGIFPSRS